LVAALLDFKSFDIDVINQYAIKILMNGKTKLKSSMNCKNINLKKLAAEIERKFRLTAFVKISTLFDNFNNTNFIKYPYLKNLNPEKKVAELYLF
jgi:hypothetical protein